MKYLLLCGRGLTYCEQCRKLCGRAPRKKARPRTTYVRKTKPKPAHLKYVRYHPNTIVTPGWSGIDGDMASNRAVAKYAVQRPVSSIADHPLVIGPVGPNIAGVPVVLRGTKRKRPD